MNNEGNQKTFLIVVIIMLLATITYASTSQTLNFFGSIGEGSVKESNWLLGLVNDICKVIFPIIIGIAVKQKNYFMTTLLIVVTTITMMISYMASQGLDLNVALGNEQEAILNDDTYKRNTDIYSSTSSTIASLRAKELSLKNTNLEDEYKNDSKILQLENERELAKKKFWLTTPAGSPRRGVDVISKDIISRKSEIANELSRNIESIKIDIKTQENLKLNADSELNNITADKLTVTKGYHALAKSMGKTVDKIAKFKNIFMEILPITLSLILGMLLGQSSINISNLVGKIKGKFQENKLGFKTPEIVNANSQKEIVNKKEDKLGFKTPEIVNANSQKEIVNKKEDKINSTRKYTLKRGIHNFTPYPTQEKVIEKKIGFVSLTKHDETCTEVELQQDDILKYINFMYEYIKPGNVSVGVRRIADNTGLKEEICRKIKAHLERLKVLKSEGLKTKILKNKDECLKKIN